MAPVNAPSVAFTLPHVEPEGLISAVELPSQIYPYNLSPTVVPIAGICIFVIGEPGAMASTLLASTLFGTSLSKNLRTRLFEESAV